LKEQENKSKSNSLTITSIGINSKIQFDPQNLININPNSISNSVEELELSDDNSILINYKNLNIYNIKEKAFEPNSFAINNLNNKSLLNNKLNKTNTASNFKDFFSKRNTINNSNNINNPTFNKIFKDDFQINNNSLQKEKRKKKKLSSLFSDFFSSNNHKKNPSLDYNSFIDSNSMDVEMINNKKLKVFNSIKDEKNLTLIKENFQINNPYSINITDNTHLNEKFETGELDKKERPNTNSLSFNSENNKIEKQNYILESEINLSKPITIENIYDCTLSTKENQEKINLKSSKEKNKFRRNSIRDFFKEKILNNKNSQRSADKNNHRNLYENLKFSYSELENDNIKNDNAINFRKEKFNTNEKPNSKNIESEFDYETDPEDLRKIDEVIKREVNFHSPKGRENVSFTKKNLHEKEKNFNNININKKIIFDSQANINKPASDNKTYDERNNIKININKKYTNLIEEELDVDISSNTDEDNYSDVNNSDYQENCINYSEKKNNFQSGKLNKPKANNDKDFIISNANKYNQCEKNVNNDNILYRIKSSEIIDKNSINNNSNKLVYLEENNIENSSNNQFPKFSEIFGEKIETQTLKLKQTSPFGNFDTFSLFKVIVKNGEDLRQEQFATQLINEFQQIFKLEKVDCWVNTYEILATGNNSGLIEVVPNSISLDQLKRKAKGITSLRHFFEVYYGPENSKKFKNSMKNFISSLAGYSLVCYFLQIKDRHNANILIDDLGHLIHIDFGFMFTNAPGKGLKFEKAPFKLTKEFVDVMGGVNSKYFQKFRKLLWKYFFIANSYK